MIVSNEILEQIEILSAITTVAVFGSDNNILIFASTRIDFSSNSTTSSIDYNSFNGINITEFVLMNKVNLNVNNNEYISRYQNFIERRKPMNVKLNKVVPYLIFSQ